MIGGLLSLSYCLYFSIFNYEGRGARVVYLVYCLPFTVYGLLFTVYWVKGYRLRRYYVRVEGRGAKIQAITRFEPILGCHLCNA